MIVHRLRAIQRVHERSVDRVDISSSSEIPTSPRASTTTWSYSDRLS